MVFGQHGITGQLVVKAVILAPVPVVETAHIQMVCHMGALVLEPTMKQRFAMLIYAQVRLLLQNCKGTIPASSRQNLASGFRTQ